MTDFPEIFTRAFKTHNAELMMLRSRSATGRSSIQDSLGRPAIAHGLLPGLRRLPKKKPHPHLQLCPPEHGERGSLPP